MALLPKAAALGFPPAPQQQHSRKTKREYKAAGIQKANNHE
jgi:hypothetical protein